LDVGLCTTSVLAKNAAVGWRLLIKKSVWPQNCRNLPMRGGIMFEVPKMYTKLDPTLFYILILGTYGKVARKHEMLALGVCGPQTCSSAGHVFAASRSRVRYYRRIVLFPQHRIQ